MRYLTYETVNSKFVLPLGRSTLRKKETISVMEKSRGKKKILFSKGREPGSPLILLFFH